jgi:hypothetical protein
MLAADEPPLLDEQPSCNRPGRVARAAGSAQRTKFCPFIANTWVPATAWIHSAAATPFPGFWVDGKYSWDAGSRDEHERR